MNCLYGDIPTEQFDKYREKLHNKIFWLLIYKDPKTKQKYTHEDFDRYFKTLMNEINGMNTIIGTSPYILEMMSLLQAAYDQTTYDHFDYNEYRKFVLDAHSVLDKVEV